ncbi:MAG TPA: NRDE family protein, partial [Burkholderiales bacterium]|nr:NRDE family protein [Burkholderiales bacterium]
MCLIALAWRVHPEYPLIVAANRDEFHARPAAPAAFWDDYPEILAGRDLEARGTWMGVSRSGGFGAVTNYRGARERRAVESRGALVSRFLLGVEKAGPYVDSLK